MKEKLKNEIKNYFTGDGELGEYRVLLVKGDDFEGVVEARKDSIVKDLEKIIDKID